LGNFISEIYLIIESILFVLVLGERVEGVGYGAWWLWGGLLNADRIFGGDTR